MTHSSLTNQIRLSPQRSGRGGVRVDTFLIHHQAGTNDNAVIDSMVSGSKGVSAQYTISNEGRLTLVVDERDRAWTSGSPSDGGKGAAWDARSITVEIENETAGPDWRISDAALNTAARLLNDLRRRYGIVNVLGHSDLWTRFRASYPTYCPGPNTVAAILSRATTLAGGGDSTPIDNTQEEDDDMPKICVDPSGAQYLVGKVNRLHLDGGSVDLWWRYVDHTTKPKAEGDRMFTSQMDAIILMQRAVDIPADSPAFPTPAALAAALAPLLNVSTPGEDGDGNPIDTAALALQLYDTIAPEFAKLNANIDDSEADVLARRVLLVPTP